MAKPPLITYASNVYSQNGEDGVLAEICKRLALSGGWFVEFGAWDGKHLSNTYALLESGWRGVYIEGDPIKFAELAGNAARHAGAVIAIRRYIAVDGPDRLDCVLAETAVPRDFGVLSIDIDSFDFQVWHSLRDYRPKIVIIEGNSEVLPGVWQIHQPGVCQGSSFSALTALGARKGYTLCCHTGNLVFVVNELADGLGLDEVSRAFPETLFNYRRHAEEIEYQRQVRNIAKAETPPWWRRAGAMTLRRWRRGSRGTA